MVLGRNVMEPHRVDMLHSLRLSGKPWDSKEVAREVALLRAGHRSFRLRAYRGIIAAEGVQEKQFLATCVRIMRDPLAWECLPSIARSIRRKNQAFKAFGRSIALNADVEESIFDHCWVLSPIWCWW